MSFFLISMISFGQDIKIKAIVMGKNKFSKAIKKVYVAEVRVNYQLLYSQTETASGGREIGGGYRGDAKVGLTLGVKGLETKDIQEITDKIYEYYLNKLKEAGYEIISANEASTAKQYEGFEMKSGGTASEAQFPGLVSVVPNNYQYMIRRTTSKGKEKNRFNAYKLSAQLGGALVTKLNLNVLFVEDAESGFSKSLSKTVGGVAKIVVRPNLRISSGPNTYGQFYFAEREIKPLASASMELKKDLEIPGIFEDRKYKAAKSSQSDLWGSSIGTMTIFHVSDSYLSKTIPLECDAQKYKDSVEKAAMQYIDAIFTNFNSY